MLAVMPYFHSYGLAVGMNVPIANGLTMVQIPNPRDMTHVLKSIDTHRVTYYCGVPTMFISIFVTLIFWKYIGFGTEMMPSVQLIRSKVYLSMLATGDVTSTINPLTFIGGGLIGALLEVFSPVSMMGLGMGLFLPPHYIVTMGVGGIIRYVTNKWFGESFYKEKGRLIVTGLMASSLIVQVAMTILLNFR